MKKELIREVKFTPAYDKRHPDPKQNYGVGGVKIFFVLKGELGAVQFVLITNWYPIDVQEEFQHHEKRTYFQSEPLAADIGYHSPKPIYEDQRKMEHCDHLPGGCYYDGSGLRAQEFLPEFLEGGSDAVWAMLETYYCEMFLGGE